MTCLTLILMALYVHHELKFFLYYLDATIDFFLRKITVTDVHISVYVHHIVTSHSKYSAIF